MLHPSSTVRLGAAVATVLVGVATTATVLVVGHAADQLVDDFRRACEPSC